MGTTSNTKLVYPAWYVLFRFNFLRDTKLFYVNLYSRPAIILHSNGQVIRSAYPPIEYSICTDNYGTFP